MAVEFGLLSHNPALIPVCSTFILRLLTHFDFILLEE